MGNSCPKNKFPTGTSEPVYFGVPEELAYSEISVVKAAAEVLCIDAPCIWSINDVNCHTEPFLGNGYTMIELSGCEDDFRLGINKYVDNTASSIYLLVEMQIKPANC